jgi:ribosome-associated protein
LANQAIALALSRNEQLNALIVDGMQDKKGKNVVKLDMRKLHDAPADFFIICEGDSNVHVKAISDSIHRKVKDALFTNPSHVEGGMAATWVLMDYFNTIVHVFHKETREFYQLEDLWSDAKVTEYNTL